MLNTKQFNKGGTIRTLIAVLLAVLLVTLAAPHSKATPVHKHINSQAQATKVVATVTTASPTVTAKAPESDNKTPVATVAKAETPPAQQVTYASGCSTYSSIFSEYSWNVSVAMAICQAESGGNPYAVSSTNDFGLMQLHDEEIFNPSANIAGAYRKYEVQGWEAWTTYNTGAYLKYL